MSDHDPASLLRRIEALEAENRRLRGKPGAEAGADAAGHTRVLELLLAERTADRNALWQLSTDVMLRATFDGEITAANPAWHDVLGWETHEIVGTNLFALIHPDDIERTRTGAAALADGQSLAHFDNRYRHRDGSYRWLSWSARPGENLINAVGRDMTLARAQATAMRDLEDFSRLALSAVGGVGVWRYDIPSDRFFCDSSIAQLYAIDAAEGMAGISREAFLANVLPEDMQALRATMSGGLVNQGDLELEYRIRHPDGSVRWVLSRGHTYFDESGKAVRRTGVGIDMTKQRLLEEQLRQSQKLEAIGQLTGGIAHDFNNILATIKSSLDLLRRRLPGGLAPEIERYLNMSTRAVGSAASLTHRLLAFSRKQTLDIRPVDVTRLALGMEELLRRTLGEQVDLRLAPDAKSGLARTDPHQLESALLNLAINARDAMPQGGTLSIAIEALSLAGDEGAASQASLSAMRAGDYIVIAVTDTGIGMSPETASRAFDPFFTTKPMGQGTGLGLSMIYGFAKQSGGDVALESTLGRGTTVRIYLPRASETSEETGPRLPAQAPRGAGEHVLVVEDQADVRRVVLDVLAECGYRTSEAADARAALALLDSGLGFDLLLTDAGLPGMTGRELANEARKRHPSLKVLFMTGYAKEAPVRGEFLGDGMDMIAKPFAVDELAGRVHAMTRR